MYGPNDPPDEPIVVEIDDIDSIPDDELGTIISGQ